MVPTTSHAQIIHLGHGQFLYPCGAVYNSPWIDGACDFDLDFSISDVGARVEGIAEPKDDLELRQATAAAEFRAHRDLLDARLGQVIAPPLTEDELQTLREAIWKREISTQWPNRNLIYPEIFPTMSLQHLLTGGPVRVGDFMALGGIALSGIQPNTYDLAKKWQGYMKCVGSVRDPSCADVSY
jgi:hypothetical protein